MFFSCNVAFSSMPVFLPTIIKEQVHFSLYLYTNCTNTPCSMGYSSITSQALSAPPYLVAFAAVLITTYISDRKRSRSPYLILHVILSAMAYLAIAVTGHFHAHLSQSTHIAIRYFCVYPATAGFFSAITLIITWTMDNKSANEGKGASVAVLNLIGQCGPLLGTRLYPDSDGPWYVRGMAVCALFMAFVAVLAFVLRALLRRANARSNSDYAARERDGEIEMDERAGWEEREGLMEGNGKTGLAGPGERFTFII
jgi:cbb3-type cytochrome oxidase subunit 3